MPIRFKYIRITTLIIVFFVYTSSLMSQQLTGTITNRAEDETINFKYSKGLASKEDSTTVDSNGVFIKDFRLTKPSYVLLTYSSFRKLIYVFPGGKLNITFDASNDSTFQKSFAVKGDYLINRYLDTISKTQLHYEYIMARVNTRQPVDSLTQVLNDFRFFFRTRYGERFLQMLHETNK